MPVITPFNKIGNVLIEDNGTTPVFKTKHYRIEFSDDISVDYTND